ncbi:MAG: hypothetical protein ACX930_07740 [Erythrobacter sp.]
MTTAALAQELRVTDPAPFLMDETAEIALSKSAAPPAISDDASVLVLQRDGSYRTAVEGDNGWTCFTGRAWTGPAQFEDGKRVWREQNFDPKIRAPQCFNAAATPTMLKTHLIATWHIMQGASTDEVDLAIGNAVTTGAIQPPATGAMSYMFSPEQVLTPDGGRFHPHVMLYQPHVTQESYGQGSPMQGVPMVTEGGSIFATTVILSSHWSDGTPAH